MKEQVAGQARCVGRRARNPSASARGRKICAAPAHFARHQPDALKFSGERTFGILLAAVGRMSHKLRAGSLAPLGLLTLALTSCGGSSSNDSEQQCFYGGRSYDVGNSFPAQDGCNTCSCEPNGNVACTLLGCDTCDEISSRYADALAEAKACDPEQADQCSELVVEGLACGCEAFVNAGESEAIEAAALAKQQYLALSCGEGITCGPCLAPSSAYCSAAGRCE
jgi:hypothetical protein